MTVTDLEFEHTCMIYCKISADELLFYYFTIYASENLDTIKKYLSLWKNIEFCFANFALIY